MAVYTKGSAGVAHSLLLRADGVVFGAGDNTYGQLGIDTGTGGIDKYTVLMLHCQGANGGTSFPDSSFANQKTVTAEGSAVTSTAEAMVGQTSSGYFDGSAYLEIAQPDESLNISGDFTIDFWLNPADTNAQDWCGLDSQPGSYNKWFFGYNSSQAGIVFVSQTPGGATLIGPGNTTNPIIADGWQHIAVCRQGTTWYFFLNGNLIYTTVNAVAIPTGIVVPMVIGNEGEEWKNTRGFLQEFRFSKGIARWTENFTPPTAPYTRPQETAFTQVTELAGITAVAAGGYHSLALDSSGNVWATGLNNHGQLGQGDTTNLNTWTQVTALSDIVSIAAGEYHSIAVDSDGDVWAWGYDSAGQLGDGLTADVSTPEQVM
jgi:hypothetical protein